jgi:UDP-N-acetylglucosamine 1-carboxyvinyltransferase
MRTDPVNIWGNAVLHSPVLKKQSVTESVELRPETVMKPSNLDYVRVKNNGLLNGTIPISGAKNAALKHLCATMLTGDAVQFDNLPVGLKDIQTLAALLQEMGVRVSLNANGSGVFQADNITSTVAPYDLVRKMRASVLVMGPLLARMGHAEVSLPGGCAIGTRPIDMHLDGFRAMGADIVLDDGYVRATATAGGLKGADIFFPKVSVGATENVMMAATLAKGTTRLMNAAREPEIVDQANALIKMGAKISGHGTDTITIEGVPHLHGCTHEILADRIETGTFMIAVALTGGTVKLKKTQTGFLTALISPLRKANVSIETDGDDVIVHRNGKPLRGTDIMTEPYPGFATDLQAQFMTMLTMCEGAGMVTETIFENRFMHVPELCRMGANITVQGNSAIVRGVSKLKGAEVMATDLRASVSLILAGLVAEGETTVNRIYHLDRGYENLMGKLQACGASITRGRHEVEED